MSIGLARLLQLSSPTLPVGGYTYSQGLERAVDIGWITDERSALQWIGDVLEHSIASYELPLLVQLHKAWRMTERDRRHHSVASWNADYLCSREAAELHAETVQMGYSLRKLLNEFDEVSEDTLHVLDALRTPAYPVVWSALASAWQLPVEHSVTAYAFAWLENQTMASLKTVPLGQAAGQRVMHALGQRLPAYVERAMTLPVSEWSNISPALAIMCSQHETQYSRLFRS